MTTDPETKPSTFRQDLTTLRQGMSLAGISPREYVGPLLLSTVATVAHLVGLGFLILLIHLAVEGEATGGRLARLGLDLTPLGSGARAFAFVAALALVATAVQGVVDYAARRRVADRNTRAELAVASHVLAVHLRWGLQHYDMTSLGGVAQRMRSMPAQAARCSQFVDRTLEAGASFLLYLVALVYLSPGLAIVAVVLLGFYLHGFNVLLRRIEDLTEQVDADDARSAVRTLELLRNLPLVWLLGTEDEEVERAAEAGRQRSRLGITRERLEDGVKPLRESLTVAVTIAFILLAVLLARGMGSESLGIYLLFFLIFRRAIAKFAGILTVRSDLRVHADRLRRLLDTVRAEPPFVVSGGTSRFDGIARGLAVRDLEFGYRQRKPVLKGVSMDIEAGSTTYLVGATGCGKTTVVKLFLRLYEFENGAIRVDGTDIREYDVRSWRKAMGFCGSQPLLFDDTVRANVTYGIEDVSEDRIWKAAELAEAREFLEEMDDRLDEVVGEQGSHLSMGQAQRIGLMRLFLRPTPVVILDEATSALDPATEATILENLDSGGTGRTTLIVAHRLNIIPEDAPVVVMARGRVADQGTREELLSRRGEFRRLWRGMERSRRGTGMGRRSAG